MTKELTHQEILDIVRHVDKLAKKMYEQGGDIWIEAYDTEAKVRWMVENGIKSKRGASTLFKKQPDRMPTPTLEELGVDAELVLDDEAEDDEAAVPSSVVPPKYKQRYGTKANCGDELANALDGIDPASDVWPRLAADNGIDWSRWSHLNNGMRRMNLGNVLRNLAKKGTRLNLEAAYTE